MCFFGNCHCSTFAFYLNNILNKEYNIYIIISWSFEKEVYLSDNLLIKNHIHKILENCDIFIYQKHQKDHSIDASNIIHYVKKGIKLIIPNLYLYYTNLKKKENFYEEYLLSIDKLKKNILESDFENFLFIIDNHQKNLFFNTPEHPTHFILFLLSKNIYYKINNIENNIDINDYFDINYRNEYLLIKPNGIILPDKVKPTKNEIKSTGLLENFEYFD